MLWEGVLQHLSPRAVPWLPAWDTLAECQGPTSPCLPPLPPGPPWRARPRSCWGQPAAASSQRAWTSCRGVQWWVWPVLCRHWGLPAPMPGALGTLHVAGPQSLTFSLCPTPFPEHRACWDSGPPLRPQGSLQGTAGPSVPCGTPGSAHLLCLPSLFGDPVGGRVCAQTGRGSDFVKATCPAEVERRLRLVSLAVSSLP